MGLRKPDPSKHDGNLTPDVVLKNYYGYSQGEKVEGGIIAPTSSTGLGTPFQSGDNIGLQSPAQENGFHIAKGGTYGLVANKSSFGDATAEDVLSGKTFTGAAGLKKSGSLVVPEVNDWDPYEMEEEVMLDLTGYVSNGYLKASSSGSNYAAGTYILMSKTETTLTIGSGSIPLGGNLPVVKIKVDATTNIYAGVGNTVAMWVKQ